MSAIERTTDSNRTSLYVRDVPITDQSLKPLEYLASLRRLPGKNIPTQGNRSFSHGGSGYALRWESDVRWIIRGIFTVCS
jgi:hypothetical protein